jgi:hypothetical protein
MVNRAWHHHFGRGIARTVGDFGKAGTAAHRIPRCWTGSRPTSWTTAGP